MEKYVIHGIDVDQHGRCEHWHSEVDIIAIKFACCQKFYACFDCHQELAGHNPMPWPKDSFESEQAILCGRCRETMTIKEYMNSNSVCPHCQAFFNPRCELHWHLYFEMD